MRADRDLNKLELNFKRKVEAFLSEVGDKVFITEAYRSQERQNYLFKQWRTYPYKDNKKVTWTLNSNHTKWLAIDIAFKWNKLYPNDIHSWKQIAEIANKYNIEWWYDLWKTDKPHFQCNWKPLDIKAEPMKQYWKEINWCPSTVYWVKVKFMSASSKIVWLMKLKGVNTTKDSYILIHPKVVERGWDYMKKVLMHEFSHLIYHTILKERVFEKIDKTDMKLTKYEYWDHISRNLKDYITEYASTHPAEDFAELIWYNHYIENKIKLPSKCEWNEEIRFKYIIANNLYKRGLKEYLKKVLTS